MGKILKDLQYDGKDRNLPVVFFLTSTIIFGNRCDIPKSAAKDFDDFIVLLIKALLK